MVGSATTSIWRSSLPMNRFDILPTSPTGIHNPPCTKMASHIRTVFPRPRPRCPQDEPLPHRQNLGSS